MTAPEERIGAAVSAWLRDAGWQVYAEVMVPGSNRRADIVATKADEVWIVETKVAFGWAVLEQALLWREWADHVSVATAPSDAHAATKAWTLRGFNLGWLHVVDDSVAISVEPRSTAARSSRVMLLIDSLRPEHAASRAGNADSAYYRDRDERDRRIRALVAERPGLELRQALDALGLHLTPDERRALARSLVRGCVAGVQARREGRRCWLETSEVVL